LGFDINLIYGDLPVWLFLAGSVITAMIITRISIPTIVKVSKYKKLYDLPNERTSHTSSTPNLGGLAVFAALTTSLIIFSPPSGSNEIRYILGALIVLFFIGIKDDILVIDPRKKLLLQICAAIFIAVLGQMRITSFHHAIGIDGISPVLSVLFTLFVLVVVINGFNLLDGIDGLAAGMGIFTSAIYGIWFILNGQTTYAVIALSLLGSLLVFFRYNVFSTVNKIFLGDTGSLIIGIVIAVLTVRFIESGPQVILKHNIYPTPSIAVAILFIPLLDTLRVFILRLWNGKSPFKPDRNHIHHRMLCLGFNHLESTLIMVTFNLFLVIISVLLQGIGDLLIIILMTSLGTLLLSLTRLILRSRTVTEKLQQGN
jgi:UDP-GlcNAc:undecaprenyl-phosphate GlcNAc-1-phosphate transferase